MNTLEIYSSSFCSVTNSIIPFTIRWFPTIWNSKSLNLICIGIECWKYISINSMDFKNYKTFSSLLIDRQLWIWVEFEPRVNLIIPYRGSLLGEEIRLMFSLLKGFTISLSKISCKYVPAKCFDDFQCTLHMNKCLEWWKIRNIKQAFYEFILCACIIAD